MPRCWLDFTRLPRPVAKGGGSLLELNGEADHVHLLIALRPNLDLSEVGTL